jgi:hypothetical protein
MSDLAVFLQSVLVCPYSGGTVYEWREIESFPGYSVSETGFVRNDNTDRVLTRLVNQRGIVYVGLLCRGVQYKRSISVLVADAFLKVKPGKAFDTPINLDGDRHNNDVNNLTWRPLWFARKYNNQFKNERLSFFGPLEEMDSEEQFESSWTAATKYGLLDLEVRLATRNRAHVWPTHQHFRMLFGK